MSGPQTPVVREGGPTPSDATAEPSASLTDRLAKFFDAMMENVWDRSDPDGGDIQDLAEKFGLIERVDFNPDVHDDYYGVGLEPGDDWFQIAPDVRSVLSASPAHSPSCPGMNQNQDTVS